MCSRWGESRGERKGAAIHPVSSFSGPAPWACGAAIANVRNQAARQRRRPTLGPISFELSTFAVDGRTDLSLLVYNPTTPADAERIASLIKRD